MRKFFFSVRENRKEIKDGARSLELELENARDDEEEEEEKRGGLEKGRYRTRQGEIGRRYHTNRNVRGIINRLGSIGSPEKASLGAI